MPLYDLECSQCGAVSEHLREYVAHGFYEAECSRCARVVRHSRRPSLIARYMGEAVLNPIVKGGKHDTAGFAKVTRLPVFREAAAHDARLSEAVNKLPPNATRSDLIEATRSVGPGPSLADYKVHMNKPEFKEAKKQQAEEKRNNRLKRLRAGAIGRGENINMRRDRLPGDPKLTS